MRIYRHISNNWDKEQIMILHQYNIVVQEGIDGFNIYDLNLYKEMIPLLEKWDVSDTLGTEFTKKEILSAEYCVLNRWNLFGYPMPDNDNGYLELTYDTMNLCNNCGIGKIQKDDFRVKRFPKYPFWGLGWIFDEFIIETALYEKIFKPLGIACRTIRKYRKKDDGPIIERYVQLVLPVIDEPLDLSYYESLKCPRCGMTKYDAMTFGYYPLQAHPLPHIYKSKEFFGDGFSAHRKVFVSAHIRDLMIENKMVNYKDFVPCAKAEELNIKNHDLLEWPAPKRTMGFDCSHINIAISKE